MRARRRAVHQRFIPHLGVVTSFRVHVHVLPGKTPCMVARRRGEFWRALEFIDFLVVVLRVATAPLRLLARALDAFSW